MTPKHTSTNESQRAASDELASTVTWPHLYQDSFTLKTDWKPFQVNYLMKHRENAQIVQSSNQSKG